MQLEVERDLEGGVCPAFHLYLQFACKEFGHGHSKYFSIQEASRMDKAWREQEDDGFGTAINIGGPSG